jgi:hypothetical protein
MGFLDPFSGTPGKRGFSLKTPSKLRFEGVLRENDGKLRKLRKNRVFLVLLLILGLKPLQNGVLKGF